MVHQNSTTIEYMYIKVSMWYAQPRNGIKHNICFCHSAQPAYATFFFVNIKGGRGCLDKKDFVSCFQFLYKKNNCTELHIFIVTNTTHNNNIIILLSILITKTTYPIISNHLSLNNFVQQRVFHEATTKKIKISKWSLPITWVFLNLLYTLFYQYLFLRSNWQFYKYNICFHKLSQHR